MNTYADKTQENKSQSVANAVSQKQSSGESTFQFVDNRPEAIAQRKLQEMAKNSPQISQLRAFQDMASNNPQAKQAAQLQSMANSHSAQQHQPTQNKENNTGLPDNIKTGMENLSGMSLDDVKVHRNSDKPTQLQSHAYAQGTDIHLGPGQEKHLPHEVWHVVQQNKGRVKTTMQMKGAVNVNDNAGLEKEADLMGHKSLQMNSSASLDRLKTTINLSHGSIVQCLTDKEIEEKYKADIKSMNAIQNQVILKIVKIDGWQAFRGGHVVVNGKELFLQWRTFSPRKTKKTDQATARKQGILSGSLGSSHYPNEDGTQYEIRLPNLWFGNNWGTVLFGLRNNPGVPRQKQTWFQVEGHSGTLGESKIRFFTDVLMHGADFAQHKRFGLSMFGADVVNVGPFGTDPASEKSKTERVY